MSRPIAKYRVWDTVEERFLQWDDIQESTVQDIFNIPSLVPRQWTGLLDKNGKEIYEGDILSVERNCLWDDGRHNIAVEFRHGCFVSSDNGTALSILNSGFRPQVIGNIYETPDLLA